MKNGCLLISILFLSLLIIEWIGIGLFVVIIVGLLLLIILNVIIAKQDDAPVSWDEKKDYYSEASENNQYKRGEKAYSSIVTRKLNIEKFHLPVAIMNEDNNLLHGSTVAVQGYFDKFTSSEIKNSLISYGATVQDELTIKTDILIQGRTNSVERLQKAEKYKIKYGKLIIINEDGIIEFLKGLKQT